MAKSPERNGVLIFVSPRSRKFAVVGDTWLFTKSAVMFFGRRWRKPWPAISVNPNSLKASPTASAKPANYSPNIFRDGDIFD